MPSPSLFADTVLLDHEPPAGAVAQPSPAREAGSLLDLLYDGFYMVMLLRSGHVPPDAAAFRERLRSFLAAFERGAKRLGAPAEDVHDAKFAFCALVDEVVLRSGFAIGDAWGRRPLQLELFGEQLAGERFFDVLEGLRAAGAARLDALEIHHMVLLLGFEGRYAIVGAEKLAYLTSRVGEEIAGLRGRRAGFAPHWAAPDRIAHALRREIPAWVIAPVFALCGLIAFAGLRWTLDRQTEAQLAGYAHVVTLAPPAAHVMITLP